MAAVAADFFLSSSSIVSSNTSIRTQSRRFRPIRQKPERKSSTKSSMLNDSLVDSFLVSSSSNVNGSSIIVTRQETGKSISAPKKRYVSSFKTLVNATNDKHTQRLNYINDSVMIFKLSKDKSDESDVSSKSRPNVTTSYSAKTQPCQSSETRSSPLNKNETQRKRTTHHESLSTPHTQTDYSLSTSSTPQIAMHSSTSLHTIQLNQMTRQKTMIDVSSQNPGLFPSDRFKSSVVPTTVRPGRTNFSSNNSNNGNSSSTTTFLSGQQTQRTPAPVAPIASGPILNGKSRFPTQTRDQFDYPDPFTNCPQEILNRLSQLTKFQLETIDWEKKRRFTKKKIISNNQNQGKDSP